MQGNGGKEEGGQERRWCAWGEGSSGRPARVLGSQGKEEKEGGVVVACGELGTTGIERVGEGGEERR